MFKAINLETSLMKFLHLMKMSSLATNFHNKNSKLNVNNKLKKKNKKEINNRRKQKKKMMKSIFH